MKELLQWSSKKKIFAKKPRGGELDFRFKWAIGNRQQANHADISRSQNNFTTKGPGVEFRHDFSYFLTQNLSGKN